MYCHLCCKSTVSSVLAPLSPPPCHAVGITGWPAESSAKCCLREGYCAASYPDVSLSIRAKESGKAKTFRCASSLVTRVSRSPPLCDKQGVLVPRRPRPRKRQLKSGFAFVQSLSRLLQLNYYVEFKRTLFEPNSQEPHSRIERERKFSRRLFTSSIKRDTSHFPVIAVQ